MKKGYRTLINLVVLVGCASLVKKVIGYKKEIKELKEETLKLQMLAEIDTLTCINNRTSMQKYIVKAYEDYKDNHKEFSVILCDIDYFKQYNDKYGHDYGDEVLKSIATTLKSFIRENDFLCRWGGEEFLLFIQGANKDLIYNIAERIRKQVESSLNVTMTFGVASVTEAKNYTELFKLIDSRLYEGKNKGKNVVIG